VPESQLLMYCGLHCSMRTWAWYCA